MVGEKDLGVVGVIPDAFLGVGEDFVGVLEFLGLRGGFFLGETRFHKLVRVALGKKKMQAFLGNLSDLDT